MKIGMRKPSVKRSFTARTTGRLKRVTKKGLVPGYGSKSNINIHPVRAARAKLYRKTTFSLWNLFK